MLLLLMLVACTEDAAEVDDLVRGEEYVQVRMQVPGMKAAATRAEDGEITSVTALVFQNGNLNKVVSATDLTATNFKIPRPKSGDIIHFLANVPSDVTIPQSGTQEEVLCALTTSDDENLSYWGTATYTSGDVVDNVTLYRNMAKVEIAAGDECTFPEDQLFIAGLVNANQAGALVPYNGSFNFDLTTNDYFTLPADVETETDAEERPLVTSLYVFEHENPETEEGLYVICKIGKYYYKVALIDDTTGQPYDLVRNHRYVIYVNDLEEGARTYELALEADPVNFEVVEMKDVTLTLTPKITTLTYGETSEEQVTITVSGINNAVESLTLTAPGFSVLTDYATLQDGKYILDDGISQIDFTLTLTDPLQAGTISVTGAGEYVNSINTATTTISLAQREEVNGEIVMWQGAVAMHNNTDDGTTHAGKVLIPYSFFFDADGTQKILADSKISLEYDKNETGYIQTYLFKDEEPSIWDISDGTELTLTQELLTKIKNNHKEVWGVDAAFVFEGGNGAVLKKVTLIPAKESIVAIADKSQLYYDSNDAQVVTVDVTIPTGVSAITIGGAENFAIVKTAGDGTLNGTTYTMGSGRTATFTFTLNQQDVTTQQTITFSGENVNAASVTITMVTIGEEPGGEEPGGGTEIVLWNTETVMNWNDVNFTDERIGQNVGGKLKIDIVAKSGAQVQLYYPSYQSISGFTEGENRTFEFLIESATNNDIRINGHSFTLKKVYIVPASQ